MKTVGGKRYLTKAEAVKDFVESAIDANIDFPKGDMIGWRMAWNEHFDRLCRGGYVSPGDCERGWLAPDSIPRRLIMTRHGRDR